MKSVIAWNSHLLLVKSAGYTLSLHHQKGYLVIHWPTGKDLNMESDPAQDPSHPQNARESKTTWSYWRTLPGSPGVWSAGETVSIMARYAHHRQQDWLHRLLLPCSQYLKKRPPKWMKDANMSACTPTTITRLPISGFFKFQ